MEIKLKSMKLENYKKFSSPVTFAFSERTKINGKNREGKSTLMNAYLEILTGKQVDGTQPDGIRPHDENGKDLNRADVIREVTLQINNEEMVIAKTTKQKWRKPHGQTEEILDGNEVRYQVDGFEYRPKKFEEFMNEIADPQLLLMCSNPNPFLTTLKKSTAETRALLEKLSGFNLQEFLKSNQKYDRVATITKGHSIEETLKKLNKQLTDQKKKLREKETQLMYEQTRENGHVDNTSDLKAKILKIDIEIEKLNEAEEILDSSVKEYDEISSQIYELKEEQSKIKTEEENKLLEEKNRLLSNINELKAQIKENYYKRNMSDLDLNHSKNAIERHSATRKSLLEEWKTVNAKEFTWNESDVCEYSGQPCDFIKNKNEENRAREESLFNRKKLDSLKQIEEAGKKETVAIKNAKEVEIVAEESIKKIDEEIESINKKVNELTNVYENFSTIPVLFENKEYVDLVKQIEIAEEKRSVLDNGSEKRNEIKKRRNELIHEKAKCESEISIQEESIILKNKQIEKLENEFNTQKQLVADVERDIECLRSFSVEKNEALANKINPYFKHFHFNFLEFTFEGNPVETCKLVCNGTSYQELNGGDRKLVEADLCVGLQKMNGISLPIWIDEANTIDSWRIPDDIEQQLILISRTDDELKVEQAK